MERDDDVRTACFLALDVLRARFGDELPYRGALDQGFRYSERRIPFMTPMRGIYRAARVQQGPAALSINTSFRSPYNDEQTDEGFLYAYQAGSIDNLDNRALRAAHELQVPIVYFWGGFGRVGTGRSTRTSSIRISQGSGAYWLLRLTPEVDS